MATTKDPMFTDTSTITQIFDNATDYDYSTEYEDEVCDNSIKIESAFTPVFFSILVILSLLGNILVILILAKYENLKSVTNSFILNLAVSDFLFTIGLPFWAHYHIYGWTFGEPACKIVNFVFYVGFYSSGILLILMTIHRYVAVMNPLSDIVSATGIYSVVASVIIWATSILIASPAFIFTEVQGKSHCVYKNSIWSLYGIYQQNVLFILSSVVFIFCYFQIICRLIRPTAQRRKNRTLKLIFTLMVVFFVSWAPYNIVIFLQSLHIWHHDPSDSKILVAECQKYMLLENAFYISRVFAFSHCFLNPVFYVFVGIKFKNHFKKMLNSWGHNKNTIRSRPNRLTITSLTSGEEFSI